MKKHFFAFLLIFSSSASFSQSPGNVSSNLQLWLKADAGVTGSAPVSGWGDQSGNGYNATDIDGPDLLANRINF